MTKTKRRLWLWTLSGLLSVAVLGLSSRQGSADWHYNYTSSPAVAPPQSQPPGNGVGYGNCTYSLPTGNNHTAQVGVHFNHSWVFLDDQWQPEFNQYGQSLGYSPEASIYHQCKNSSGATSWFGSDYYALWQSYHNGRSNDESLSCPASHPWVVGAYCFTRAWW